MSPVAPIVELTVNIHVVLPISISPSGVASGLSLHALHARQLHMNSGWMPYIHVIERITRVFTHSLLSGFDVGCVEGLFTQGMLVVVDRRFHWGCWERSVAPSRCGYVLQSLYAPRLGARFKRPGGPIHRCVMLQVPAPALQPSPVTMAATVACLEELVPDEQRRGSLLRQCPELLGCDLRMWTEFFAAYGATPEVLGDLILRVPRFFVGASLYTAGEALRFLQLELQLAPADILDYVLPEAPGVLNMSVENELAPRLARLLQEGQSLEAVRELVLRDPIVLCGSWAEDEIW